MFLSDADQIRNPVADPEPDGQWDPARSGSGFYMNILCGYRYSKTKLSSKASSVADPGCLSRIPDSTLFHPDPEYA
jgi:hypothetical protein